MISGFPNVSKGETVYSIMAKYHKMMGHTEIRATFEKVLNKDKAALSGINVDLPTIISNLHYTTSEFSLYRQLEDWVTHHTSFNYYSFFHETKIKEKLLVNYIHEPYKHGITLQIGKAASDIVEPKYLKFCMSCYEKEIEEAGVASWYWIHQIPGVFTCPFHNKSLHISKVPRNPRYLQLLDESVVNDSDVLLDIEELVSKFNPLSHLSLKISTEEMNGNWDKPKYKKSYIGLIKKAGYGGYEANVYKEKMYMDITEFYGLKIINILEEKIAFNFTSLEKLWNAKDSVQHPIYHILFLHFISEKMNYDLEQNSIRELIELGHEYFHDPACNMDALQAQFICLNAFCEYFYKNNYIVVHHSKSSGNHTFHVSCTFCGLKYRNHCIPSDFTNYKWDSLIEVGKNLDEKIISMVLKENLSFWKTAKILGLPENSIRKVIQREMNGPLQQKGSSTKKYNQKRDREEWEALIINNKLKTKTDLANEHYALFKRLRRYDREWLDSRDYKKAGSMQNIEVVDWKQRDKEYLIILKEAYKELLKEYKPKKISHNTLTIKANIKINKKYQAKLPQTFDFINEVKETNDQFAIRKAKMILDHQCKLPLGAQYKPKNMTHKVGYYNKISDDAKKHIRKMLDDFYNEVL
ncbi:hypothetical protein GLW08_11830 [Pontibacillus yanchengensis]|uniref:Uncharacterized protein n=1 Tax=Pontibacillus yanchengensis TaxID=462910 RepID=A0ACC7VGY1_9BACI|nr:TnsD family Tn7-like transposition protein [Pontibacillus yanchengensis]MYL54027.1 hypothetical protein [Pontibacillus yanchengensis]